MHVVSKPSTGGNLFPCFLDRILEMIFVSVLPEIEWVKDKLGSCPGSLGFAHRQPGFPHRRYRPPSDPGRIPPSVANPAFSSAALCSSS
jgi:hypothetical protein